MWWQITALVLLLSIRIELTRIAEALSAEKPAEPEDE